MRLFNKSKDSNLSKKKRSVKKILGVIFVLLVIGSIANTTKDKSARLTETQQAVKTESELKKTGTNIGDDARLSIENSKVVLIAVDEKALDAYTKAALAKDFLGIGELVGQGQLFEVPNDTKVKIIEKTWTLTKVRVMEGEKGGSAGWVAKEFVKPL